jgi:hypothetical protein
MSIFKKLFNRKKNQESFRPVNVEGLMRIPIKCPLCGEISDMFVGDPRLQWYIQRKDVGDLIPAECPYCKIGMLVCIRDNLLLNIEPFDDTPESLLSAIEKTIQKVVKE